MAPKRPSSPGPTSAAAAKSPANENRQRRGGAGAAGAADGGDNQVDERGEFEDAWEDEFEEEDVEEGESDSEDEADDGEEDGMSRREARETGMEGDVNAMDIEKDEEREPSPIPYLPGLGQGDKLGEDEELVADMTSYVFLHHARLAWPCLSFDILRDNLGEQRVKAPHSACIVAGTQADATGGPSTSNEVCVMKFDGMQKNKRSRGEDSDDDGSDDDDSDSEDGNGNADDEAVLTYRSIPHNGGVNRIRAQNIALPYTTPAPEPPNGKYHVATFSETGKVHIFDIAPHLASLQSPATHSGLNLNNTPVFTADAHKRAEGFALAWSAPIPNAPATRLLSGDVHSKIFMHNMTESGFQTSSGAPFGSHTNSIEDMQWSPSEPTVFGSVSSDRSLRIWDIRVRDRKSVVVAPEAHEADINVMSWNSGASSSYLVLTGGDEGGLKVWDLRNMKGSAKGAAGGGGKSTVTPVASFNWHKAPITSVEWHPTEDSCFAASSADDSVTLWDLSVELDEEEKLNNAREMVTANEGRQDKSRDVPPQLLFVHQGQKEIKEVHWHPQIPGTVISTSLDNFAVFKTISV